MKKISSILMLAMMMIAALSFTACGDDDDTNNSGGGENPTTQQALKVDGKSYYNGNLCNAKQTKNDGMYLTVTAVENINFQNSGKELVAHIKPNKVADLKVGDVFDTSKLSIQTFRNLSEIPVNTYMWNVVEGNISITKITDIEMTVQINNLKIKHKNSGVEHTISGIAVLNSGVYGSDKKLLSFADAVK